MEQNKLQVMLAAYVLGEASAEECAEIERALANSAELRADRERLEATIGLVQTHLGSDAVPQSLSPESAAVLERAAQHRATPIPSVRWYQRTGPRIAASILFVGFAWIGYQQTQEGGSDSAAFPYPIFGDDVRVARAPSQLGYTASLDKRSKERARGDGQALEALGYVGETSGATQDLTALRDLGYLGNTGSSAPKASKVAAEAPPPSAVARGPADEERVNEIKRAVAFERQSGGKYYAQSSGDQVAGNEERALADAELRDRLSKLGYLGGRPKAPVAHPEPPPLMFPPLMEQAFVGSDTPTGAYSSRSAVSPQGTATAFFDFGAAGGNPLPGSTADAGRGADDFFLGHGEQGKGKRRREQSESLQALGYMDRGDVEALLRREAESCLTGLVRQQREGPRAMFFRFWGDNAFEYTVLDHLSTFAADVDTASYTLARGYLIDGNLPTKAQVRTEEFVNYFDAEVAAPTKDTFTIHTELAPSRFNRRSDAWMLRVVVAGKEVSQAERQPLTLTFVIDTSGSMKQDQRLQLVKHSLRLLLTQLDARDSISIVAFSNEARLILPMTSARQGDLIEAALEQLRANGGTNAESGLLLGYAQAEANLAAGTTNRVVFLSDGVANMGQTDQGRLTARVAGFRMAGIYLNTIGVGMGNHNDTFLEQLADKGDGLCNYIDDELEARRALVENFTGAFEPIARDVKIQVEFDPAQVETYRLLGYENRAVADRDFRNDAVDAGELNAGHEVVALYELTRTGRAVEAPLATVRLRWKRPYTEGVASKGDEVATEGFSYVRSGAAAPSFAAASAGYRKSVLVAQFAEVLRRSIHAEGDSFGDLLTQSRALARELKHDEDFTEFFDLLVRSRRLLLERLERVSRWDRARDHLQRSAYLAEQARLIEGRLDALNRAYTAAPEGTDKLAARVSWIRARLDRLEISLDDEALRTMELETDVLRARLTRLLEQM